MEGLHFKISIPAAAVKPTFLNVHGRDKCIFGSGKIQFCDWVKDLKVGHNSVCIRAHFSLEFWQFFTFSVGYSAVGPNSSRPSFTYR